MGVRRLGVLLLAAVVPLGFAGAALAGSSGTGSITGTVTDSGGNRLPDICVSVVHPGVDGSVGNARTNSAGEYAVSNVPAGDPVTVVFDDCQAGNYATQWYQGATRSNDATDVVVPDGSTVTGIDATMLVGVTISGTVTDASSGAPVPNACVFLSEQGSSGRSQAGTGTSGRYSFGPEEPGSSYVVEFDAGCGSPSTYIQQWYDGADTESAATLLTGSPGQAFTSVDAQLQPNPNPPPPPTVTGVSPASGPTSGGSYVTITGTNFSADATVMFGGQKSTHVAPMSTTELDAVAPAQSGGAVDITVTTHVGTSAVTAADQFTYDPSQPPLVPTITSVSPASGPTSGSAQSSVVIIGENLGGATSMSFGDTPVGFSIVSNTELEASAPAHAAGTVDVTVNTDPLGPTAQTSADRYTYTDGPGTDVPEAPLPLLIPITGIVAGGLAWHRRRNQRALIANRAD